MDDVNIKCKCSEVRDIDLIDLREQYASTCKDITNVQVENDYNDLYYYYYYYYYRRSQNNYKDKDDIL